MSGTAPHRSLSGGGVDPYGVYNPHLTKPSPGMYPCDVVSVGVICEENCKYVTPFILLHLQLPFHLIDISYRGAATSKCNWLSKVAYYISVVATS